MTLRHIIGGLATALVLAVPAAAQADDALVQAGERIFRQCMTCHVVQPGMNRIGPSLHNIMGREAGQVEGFNYSPAMANSGIVWTPENVDAYLADPRGYIPGNRMAFAGLRNPQQREAVIAYLIDNSPDYDPAAGGEAEAEPAADADAEPAAE